jgi:predicted DsbA family dithiol-disulfide isomerase
MSERVQLTVFSDYLCPWCYNGAVRLAGIEKEFGPRVAIEWKSFLLRPQPEPKPMDAFRRYTESWRNPASQPEAGRFTVWSTDEPPPSHSIPPNVAGKAAARQGAEAFSRYHHALLDAYFYANRNITDVDNLVRIAGETGLDVDAFLAAMQDPTLTDAVIADHTEAIQSGIQGVPTVIVDQRWKITGAVDSDVYRDVIKKRLADEPL